MKITYTCQQCGETVTKNRTPATLRGGTPKFCSQKCNGASRKGAGSGPRPNHEFDCEVCGNHCHVYRSPSAHAPATCSLTCTGIKNRGDGNGSWSGGRHVANTGYVRVLDPENPGADTRGYVYEHRLVMESIVGRRLHPGEVVHHRNLIKTDNRPENLQLCASQAEHLAIHRAMKDSA